MAVAPCGGWLGWRLHSFFRLPPLGSSALPRPQGPTRQPSLAPELAQLVIPPPSIRLVRGPWHGLTTVPISTGAQETSSSISSAPIPTLGRTKWVPGEVGLTSTTTRDHSIFLW